VKTAGERIDETANKKTKGETEASPLQQSL
jgi:hypothetical protein